MQIAGTIKHIPTHLHHAWDHTKIAGKKTTKWVTKQSTALIQQLKGPHLWNSFGRPFYERRVRPLKALDMALVVGSWAVAGAVMIVALKCFGLMIFPLAAAVSGILVAGSLLYARYQARKHFTKLASQQMDQIRRIANEMTATKRDFQKVNHLVGMLKKPEFSHLKDDVASLERELRRFEETLNIPCFESQKQVATTYLAFLTQLCVAEASDQKIIKRLERQVERVRTPKQDLEALERYKKRLNHLKSTEARKHIQETSQAIDRFIKAPPVAILNDSKGAFLEFVKGLQRKFDSYAKIEDLPFHSVHEVPTKAATEAPKPEKAPRKKKKKRAKKAPQAEPAKVEK